MKKHTPKTTTVVAQTSKGHRIFLQGIGYIGARYDVEYSDQWITIRFKHDGTGKRKVVASKGGVIDLEGKKVSTWKRDANSVTVHYIPNLITIERA